MPSDTETFRKYLLLTSYAHAFARNCALGLPTDEAAERASAEAEDAVKGAEHLLA